jgi:hypothetical protein
MTPGVVGEGSSTKRELVHRSRIARNGASGAGRPAPRACSTVRAGTSSLLGRYRGRPNRTGGAPNGGRTILFERRHSMEYARPMQWRAGKALIVGVALVAFAPGFASAHTGAPFVSFARGKRKIAIFTKSECLHGVRCKSRVRHCNRWARNQISCQSEILFWAKDDAVTYCHWESLAWRVRRSKPLEVWSEPKPACQSMHDGPHWPARRSAQ